LAEKGEREARKIIDEMEKENKDETN